MPLPKPALWWCHPDRAGDYLGYAKKGGMIETSFVETMEDEVRLWSFHFVDAKGDEYLHRMEENLTSNGTPTWNNDHFETSNRESLLGTRNLAWR